jgi:hypothetical protein
VKRLSQNEVESEMEKSMSDLTKAKNDLNAANEELKAAQFKANAAAQSLHKAYEEQEHPQAAPVAHPGHVSNKIENDYRNAPGRWNGPDVTKRPAALTPAQLDELRVTSATKPQPTFAEKAKAAEAAGVELKPSVTIIGTRGTVKA